MNEPPTVNVVLTVEDARAWAQVESRSASGLASRSDRLGTACRAALSAPCEQQGPQGFLCTEPKGHGGPHEARGESGEWFESWPAAAPLPGEPRPDLPTPAEWLREAAELPALPAGTRPLLRSLDLRAQRVAVLESLVRRLAISLEMAHSQSGHFCSCDTGPDCSAAESLAEAREAVPPEGA